MKAGHLWGRRQIIFLMLFCVFVVLVLTAASGEAASEQSCGFYHHVQRGQTLSSIGRQYGVSVQALLRANPQVKNPDVIYAGSSIYIPCKWSGGPGTGGRCSHLHYVNFGQTLSQIAWSYRVSPYAIMHANNIHNPDLIYAGTYLCIP
jgi:LysM repeat protein